MPPKQINVRGYAGGPAYDATPSVGQHSRIMLQHLIERALGPNPPAAAHFGIRDSHVARDEDGWLMFFVPLTAEKHPGLRQTGIQHAVDLELWTWSFCKQYCIMQVS